MADSSKPARSCDKTSANVFINPHHALSGNGQGSGAPAAASISGNHIAPWSQDPGCC